MKRSVKFVHGSIWSLWLFSMPFTMWAIFSGKIQVFCLSMPLLSPAVCVPFIIVVTAFCELLLTVIFIASLTDVVRQNRIRNGKGGSRPIEVVSQTNWRCLSLLRGHRHVTNITCNKHRRSRVFRLLLPISPDSTRATSTSLFWSLLFSASQRHPV